MKIRCKYCDNYIDDTDEMCKHCGGVNKNLKRVSNKVPKTIDELRIWYKDHNLPDEKITRFFIGKDIKEPKAFGIYYNKNTKKYTVYKNKANGQRAIRYEGKDEKYAVHELYLKLKEEILNQKSLNKKKKHKKANLFTTFGILSCIFLPIAIILFFRFKLDFFKGTVSVAAVFAYMGLFIDTTLLMQLLDNKLHKKKQKFSKVAIILAIIFTIIGFTIGSLNKDNGYYRINDKTYYHIKNDWYIYDYEWIESEEPSYDGSLSDYYQGYSYDSSYGSSDFQESEYWDNYYDTSSDSDWDSGSSWDSGSTWDSGGTDWDSDW